LTRWKSSAKSTPTVTLPIAPTIWFATIASITDAVPRAMMRAYERMWPSVVKSSIGATMPSRITITGKAMRISTVAGMSSAWGSRSIAARMATTMSRTMAAERSRPSAVSRMRVPARDGAEHESQHDVRDAQRNGEPQERQYLVLAIEEQRLEPEPAPPEVAEELPERDTERYSERAQAPPTSATARGVEPGRVLKCSTAERPASASP
jgi:hypothetical protein